MRVVVLKERAEREHRVALIPESVSKLIKAGAAIAISATEALAGANVICSVQPPVERLSDFPAGSVLISLVPAGGALDLVPRIAAQQVTVLALERVPRITRAQSMDILSSQATVAGYKAVLLGATHM